MPQNLPGFYFDPEKNRYFPIKGPIPGSNLSSSNSHNQGSKPMRNSKSDISDTYLRMRIKSAELLRLRELYGKLLFDGKGKSNFQQEYYKLQASQPKVWKYKGTDCRADSAMEQFHVVVQTAEGQRGMHVLLTGSTNGSISLFEVGEFGQHYDYGENCKPDRVWPLIAEAEGECNREPGHIKSLTEASTSLRSDISSIKQIGEHSFDIAGGRPSCQHALVTTLGSGTSRGSAYIMKFHELLDFGLSISIRSEIIPSHGTIWTADCDANGTHAVLGTNRGAAWVNLESGVLSWVCHSESDIFSQKLIESGNVVLCGFRNGAIVAIDVRQGQQSAAFSAGLPRHKISLTSNKTWECQRRHGQSLNKKFFELRGKLRPSNVVSMSSAICSLVSLCSDDKYFLASSMDGFIKLYDRRLIQRGAVQSYEGHVNTHTHLQLGVDPAESFVMSGGEDCCVRIWSIKTGELLFGNKISDTIVSTVCWQQTGSISHFLTLSNLFHKLSFIGTHCTHGHWAM